MTTFTQQDSLFDSAVVVTPRKMTTEEAWATFVQRNGWFLPALAERAHELQRLGATRISVKQLFEEFRGRVDDQGTTWRLNNSWSALAARQLVERYPDLAPLFAMRRRRS